MIDWDYEYYCPGCGEEYLAEYNPDGKNENKVTCDECGKTFIVKASVMIDFDVEIKEVTN